jgi:2-polyprenyl-3-methyl-5-hydroxy-6-metoxy-1,4-benzoquinol methylase/predicted Ser/Thr protein kinase
MQIISTEGCDVIIDKKNDKVIKIIKPYWLKKCPWIIKNEVRALTKLNSKHFPKLIDYDENSITMEYAGKTALSATEKIPPQDQREFDMLPNDFEKQIKEILDELEKANLRHSDINHTHILVKDGIVKLIDFELCLEKGEPEPINYMKTMGVEAKVRTIDEPVDDRLMAERTIEKFKGGFQKIYDLIGKLPKRLQYHELPFNMIQKADRKYLKERIEMMKVVYDFKNKSGIDLGCNIGGVTFSLALEGSKMVGIDIDKRLIDIANACEDYYKLGCKFIEGNITKKIWEEGEHYDFCILLAIWHWIVKQEGEEVGKQLLKKISEKCDTMFIEINFGHEEGLTGSEETMEEIGLTNEQAVIDYIKKYTDYTEVKNIGKCIGWNNRPTFFCSK